MTATQRSQAAPRTAGDRRQPSGRRGMVLVFFALISFAVMGIIALVVDLGIARLTQRQMQSATDGMALEVLRDRDLARDPESELDHFRRDYRRRQRNARLGSWQYMDELMVGDDPALDDAHGAGAWIDMTGGMGLMNASQLIIGAGYSVPRPRPNYQPAAGTGTPLNLQQGDIVSGAYTGHQDADGDGLEDGALGFFDDPMNLESAKYDRVDFAVAPPLEAPYGDAVVARLRRTASISSFGGIGTASTYDDLPNVSSTGPRLPFLFGLGTTMHGGNPRDGYSPRFEGVAVRATSIAQARPAVRIGPPMGKYEDGPLDNGYRPGAAPFLLQKWLWNGQGSASIWEDEGAGNFSTLLKYDTGELKRPGSGSDNTPAGFLAKPRLYRLGDRVNILTGGAGDAFWNDSKNWEVEEAFVPIIRRSVNRDRIVAFGRVRTERVLTEDEETGEETVFMKVWKLGNERVPIEPTRPWIAPRNASALFDGQQVSQEELDAETFMGAPIWTWDQLIRELYTTDRVLQAPALVR